MSRSEPEKFPKSPEVFQLGDFTFSVASSELLTASGNAVRLRHQSAAVLAQLLRSYGNYVSKDSLFGAVWAGTSVTDDSLVQCISEIRQALNDRERRIIQTSYKRGYRANAAPAAPVAPRAGLPLSDEPSIAVLAFDDYSAGEDSDYLSDAIAEGIIAELSRFSELLIIARNSSFSFRGTATRMADISQRLGVRYVLEGSQQKSGDRLRVTVQLIDAPQDRHIWSEVYERDLSDLFAVQEDIVRRVVAATAQSVIKYEGRRTTMPDGARRTALLHHLEARQHLVKFTPEGNAAALKANLAAIEADPTQPYGYAGLAFVHINGHRWGWTGLSRQGALIQARAAAEKAVELGPDYYDGLAAMASVRLHENDLDGAIALARRARALNPNDTLVMCDLADFLGYAGEYDEAQALLHKAMRLDPLFPDWTRWTLAWVQWLRGNCREALETMNAMTHVPPMANRVLALIHVCLGHHREARQAVARLLEHDPAHSMKDVRNDYLGKLRRPSDYNRVIANLRAAGLPDQSISS